MIVLTAIGAAACGLSEETRERSRIVAAVEALRNAPASDNTGRIGLAEKLANEPAHAPKAVHARDVCAKAYRLLAESNLAEEAAERAIETPEAGQATRGLTALVEAQKKLDASRSEMAACSEANTALVLER